MHFSRSVLLGRGVKASGPGPPTAGHPKRWRTPCGTSRTGCHCATMGAVRESLHEPARFRSMETLLLTLAAAFTVSACHGDSFDTLPNPGPNPTTWTFRAPAEEVWRALDCVRQDARYEEASAYTPRGQVRSMHGVPSLSHVSDAGTLSTSFVLLVEVVSDTTDGTRVAVRHVAQQVQNGMSCACPHGSPGRYPNFEPVESTGAEEARLLRVLHACLSEAPPAPPHHPALPASAR